MRNETRISDVDMANIRRIFDEKNSDRHAKHGARWRSQFFESNTGKNAGDFLKRLINS